MPFWKKAKSDLTIQCPACEWNPDGKKHWACTCEHRWDTFKTKGKCPKCQTQWTDTWCPGCGQSTPQTDWYKTDEELAQIEQSGNQALRAKKKRLESRLIEYGIQNYRVSHLPYLDHADEEFQSPYEAGCRMMILYSVGYAVHNLGYRRQIIEWLQSEGIWDKVAPSEMAFLQNPAPDESLLMEFSWRIESALTLGWCLKKLIHLPKLTNNNNEADIDEFQRSVPEIGTPLKTFLAHLSFRDMDEIYEENLLNEIATRYFRDLMFSGNRDNTSINRHTSFERHQTLNWLRQFGGISEWDETDTST